MHFKPDCIQRAHNFDPAGYVPFRISGNYAVYGFGNVIEDQTSDANEEDIIRKIFMNVAKEGERIYALDWNHSAFLYNPRDMEEQKT